eukprot:TRINITY_DN38472_c0_g1_i1.p1 TRINITY_DN38472_c0_g1~~TRINITY_DN38472_c0_g1_i1.p1  ORF type:complete len:1186 (+),score=352.00 TRINITY_DN38472_c0_g1_i1:24-3581(+)
MFLFSIGGTWSCALVAMSACVGSADGGGELPSQSEVVDLGSGTSLLMDAEEACRKWKLRCLQAEAELRASTTQQQALSGQEHEDEVQARSAVAMVLGLRRHLADLEAWKEQLEQELSDCRGEAEAFEERLQLERQNVGRLRAEADQVSGEAWDAKRRHDERQNNCEAACGKLEAEARALLEELNEEPELRRELAGIEDISTELGPLLSRLSQAADHGRQEQERLSMLKEEQRDRRLTYIDLRAKSIKDTADVKRTLAANSGQIQRLKSEVLRSRTRGDRQRRQLETQLVQCRGDLSNAERRHEATNEDLRKLRNKHAAELKKLRSSMDGLQTEVDERLSGIEASEVQLASYQKIESEMMEERERHVGREMQLEQEALATKRASDLLEAKMRLTRAECQQHEEALRLEAAREDSARGRLEALEADCGAQRKRLEATTSASALLRSELREEHAECGGALSEMSCLKDLEQQLQLARTRCRGVLTEELNELNDGTKKMQAAFDRHLSDMREAARRAGRLKASHDELLTVLPTGAKGREAVIGAVEQAVTRVGKKVEGLLSFLSNKELGQKKLASAELMATSRQSQEALQQRLFADTRRNIVNTLSEERKKIVQEQQKSLDEVPQRTAELRKLRESRLKLREALADCQKELEFTKSGARAELESLREQVRLVEEKSGSGGEAVAAEFSDILQKQTLERNLLQHRVDELRREISSGRLGSLPAEEEPEEEDQELTSQHDLRKRLLEKEEEVSALLREEEELRQSYVKLKALTFARRQNPLPLAPEPRKDSSPRSPHTLMSSPGGARGLANPVTGGRSPRGPPALPSTLSYDERDGDSPADHLSGGGGGGCRSSGGFPAASEVVHGAGGGSVSSASSPTKRGGSSAPREGSASLGGDPKLRQQAPQLQQQPPQQQLPQQQERQPLPQQQPQQPSSNQPQAAMQEAERRSPSLEEPLFRGVSNNSSGRQADASLRDTRRSPPVPSLADLGEVPLPLPQEQPEPESPVFMQTQQQSMAVAASATSPMMLPQQAFGPPVPAPAAARMASYAEVAAASMQSGVQLSAPVPLSGSARSVSPVSTHSVSTGSTPTLQAKRQLASSGSTPALQPQQMMRHAANSLAAAPPVTQPTSQAVHTVGRVMSASSSTPSLYQVGGSALSVPYGGHRRGGSSSSARSSVHMAVVPGGQVLLHRI